MSNAWSRSATRSVGDSMPTDSRIRLSGTSSGEPADRGVGHLAGVLDQALHGAERLGQREQLGRRGDPLGRLGAAAQR